MLASDNPNLFMHFIGFHFFLNSKYDLRNMKSGVRNIYIILMLAPSNTTILPPRPQWCTDGTPVGAITTHELVHQHPLGSSQSHDFLVVHAMQASVARHDASYHMLSQVGHRNISLRVNVAVGYYYFPSNISSYDRRYIQIAVHCEE
jgi:hypothetical protein